MSLSFNLSKIENSGELCWETPEPEEGRMATSRMAGLTECLIYSTMFVDLGEITKKNATQFYARLYLWERTRGTLKSDGEFITMQDVTSHIGLTTNVANMTDAKWSKNFQKKSLQAAQDQARADERKAQRESTEPKEITT
jgi:hypothetical protein